MRARSATIFDITFNSHQKPTPLEWQQPVFALKLHESSESVRLCGTHSHKRQEGLRVFRDECKINLLLFIK